MAIFKQVCHALGINSFIFNQIHNRFIAQQQYYQQSHYKSNTSYSSNNLKGAYDILGIDQNATDQEVKKAYRVLMNEHHPDKLVAKGLPEEMMAVAKEKTQEIQAAYDQIREARKK